MTLMTHDDVIAELSVLIAELSQTWIVAESRIFGVGMGRDSRNIHAGNEAASQYTAHPERVGQHGHLGGVRGRAL